MDFLGQPTTLLVALHAVIIAGIGLRVVMVRPVPSVALAWLFLVVLLPGIGLFCYVSFGERRLGGRRAGRLAELRHPYVQRLREILHGRSARVDWTALPDTCESMNQLGLSLAGMPTLAGNELRLLSGAEQVLHAIREDVDRARRTLHMQFYIWHAGGIADDMVAAVLRAAQRGVACSNRTGCAPAGSRSRWPCRPGHGAPCSGATTCATTARSSSSTARLPTRAA